MMNKVDYEKAYYSNYKIIDDNDENFLNHFKNWCFTQYHKNFNKYLTTGNIIIYELMRHKFDNDLQRHVDYLHYPKVAVYMNQLSADQTVEMEYVNLRRNWEYRKEYTFIEDNKEYQIRYSDLETRVERTVMWFDDILIYGIFNGVPDWKTLKKCYQNTFWYHRGVEEKRDVTIESLLR